MAKVSFLGGRGLSCHVRRYQPFASQRLWLQTCNSSLGNHQGQGVSLWPRYRLWVSLWPVRTALALQKGHKGHVAFGVP